MKTILFIAAVFIISCNNTKTDKTVDAGPNKNSKDSVMRCNLGDSLQPIKVRLNASSSYKPPVLMHGVANKRVVLINFNGYKLHGTMWNQTNDTMSILQSGFTTQQQKQIIDTVKKLFKKFNVLITNYEPSYNKAGIYSRQIIVVTQGWEYFADTYGKSAGVSFVGTFTWGNETPAFVFPSLIGMNISHTARAIAHEIGHTLGLQHQATWTDQCAPVTYYRKGAIMGYFYGSSTWVDGSTSFGCNYKQSDTAIIKATLK